MAADDKNNNKNSNNNNNIQSIVRVSQILHCFINYDELGITEISQKTKLNKSTAFGLINTMESIGFLTQNPQTKRYRLGIKLFTFGSLVERRMDIRNEAHPYCEKLSEKYNATVHLAEYYDKSLIYIDKVNNQSSAIVYSYLGRNAPLYCTGVGKSILAFLPEEEVDNYINSTELEAFTPYTIISKEKLYNALYEIKRTGYAVDDQEIEEGLRCVAAPIFNYSHMPIAAISISNTISRIAIEDVPFIGKEIIDVTDKISKQMGYYSHS